MSLQDVKDKKPLKILVVAGAYPPNHGGGGLRVHRTYKRIVKKVNLIVSVITLQTPEHSKAYEIYDEVVIHRIKPRKSTLIQFYMIGRIIFQYELYKYSMMHGVGSSMIVVIASMWGKLFSMKLIREVTVYNDITQIKLSEKIKRSLNYFRFYLPLELSYKNAELVVALNNAIKQYYEKLGIHSSRIWVRPNPVDTSIYHLPSNIKREESRRRLGIKKENIVFLLIGQFEPRKNQRFAVGLLNNLPAEHILFLIGPVVKKYRWYYESVLSDIRESSLENRVHVFPKHSNDLNYYFQSADLVIIPSTSEGTPNVMLEALCCGIPVIVNQSLRLREFIEDGVNGWNAKLNIHEFTERCQLLLQKSRDTSYREIIASTASRKYSHINIDDQFIKYLYNFKKD
jgi:glycosyltransferase involved in cell wall biosynthesis